MKRKCGTTASIKNKWNKVIVKRGVVEKVVQVV